MSSEGVFDLEILVPDLQITVPTTSGKVFKGFGWRVSDFRNPILMIVSFNGVLAFGFYVPEFDVLFTSSR